MSILVVLLIGAVTTIVVLTVGSDDAAAAEVFLEPSADLGAGAFAAGGLEGTPTNVTTTTAVAPPSSGAGTPSVSGGTPGLYGGSMNVAVCDPVQQIEFLESNVAIASAFVEALNNDPSLRWSGGTTVSVTEIKSYFGELTSVTLTSDTRVTNYGYFDGRPTPRQAVLQAGTAVLVDAYGVPRVKCNCGNPLNAPTPVRSAPRYRGPQWSGFSPTTIVVVTEVTVQIDTYVLIDVNTGDRFARPVGTSGAEDSPDLPDTASTTTTERSPSTTGSSPSTSTSTGGDEAAFCERWAFYLRELDGIDLSDPEVLAIFEELTALAPSQIRSEMELITAALRDMIARGDVEPEETPQFEAAVAQLVAYLQNTCGVDPFA